VVEMTRFRELFPGVVLIVELFIFDI